MGCSIIKSKNETLDKIPYPSSPNEKKLKQKLRTSRNLRVSTTKASFKCQIKLQIIYEVSAELEVSPQVQVI